MKLNLSAISFLLIAFVCSGCKTQSSQNPKDYSDSLVVLSGAININYGKVNRTDQVWYNLKADYPATAVINQLLKTIEDKGWSPLKEDFMNPGMITSFVSGWSKYEDLSKQPNTIAHTWNSDWQNKNGDILKYVLGYRYPIKAQPDMSSLSVVAIYIPADLAKAMKQASLEMYKKYNQQNNEKK